MVCFMFLLTTSAPRSHQPDFWSLSWMYVCLSLWAQAALRVPTQRTWKSPAVTSPQGTHYWRSGGPEKYQLLFPMAISDFLLWWPRLTHQWLGPSTELCIHPEAAYSSLGSDVKYYLSEIWGPEFGLISLPPHLTRFWGKMSVVFKFHFTLQGLSAVDEMPLPLSSVIPSLCGPVFWIWVLTGVSKLFWLFLSLGLCYAQAFSEGGDNAPKRGKIGS